MIALNYIYNTRRINMNAILQITAARLASKGKIGGGDCLDKTDKILLNTTLAKARSNTKYDAFSVAMQNNGNTVK